MEENKIETVATVPEGHHHHTGHHGEHHQPHTGHKDACGLGCHGHHCALMGHRFIKAIVVIFIAILLLCIGAAMGARHGYRNNDNRNFYGNGGACGFRNEMPARGSADGRFYMMGNPEAVPTQGMQVIDVRSTNGEVPAMMTAPISPATSGPTTQTAPVK